MPIPTPRSDEEKQEFISRCMGNDIMKDDYPDQDTRSGVCYTQWDESQQEQSEQNEQHP